MQVNAASSENRFLVSLEGDMETIVRLPHPRGFVRVRDRNRLLPVINVISLLTAQTGWEPKRVPADELAAWLAEVPAEDRERFLPAPIK